MEPTPTATLRAADTLVDLIEPATDAFEHRTFLRRKHIDWPNGILFMDPATGLVEGYRVAEEAETETTRKGGFARPEWSYAAHGPSNRWVTAHHWTTGARLLLDRELKKGWHLPASVRLLAASVDGALLWDYSGAAILSDARFTERARFGPSVWEGLRGEAPRVGIVFSPDGRKLLWGGRSAVYVTDIPTLESTVLFEAVPHERWGSPAWVAYELTGAGQEIFVTVTYPVAEGANHSRGSREWIRLGWDGEELSRLASPDSPYRVSLAPDGLHLVWEGDGHYLGIYEANLGWPSVVVADARTGEPIFRVRSASRQRGSAGNASWLPSGDGLLLRTSAEGWCGQSRLAVLRIRPVPAIEVLPASPDACPKWPWQDGAFAAPTLEERFIAENHGAWTDDGRGEGVAVYDTHDGVWRTAILTSQSYHGDYDYLQPEWPPPGDPNPELRLTFEGGKATGGGLYLFAQPGIEFPPFGDEIAFLVARTGSCLRLRETLQDDGAVLDCLPDGSRVVMAGPRPMVDFYRGDAYGGWAAYVRTATGLEGWVAHRYLDHD